VATETTSHDVAIILDKQQFDIGFIQPDIPGSEKDDEKAPDLIFGGLVNPPIDPIRAMNAVKSNGDLAAVLSAVADGCAGQAYTIVPRFNNPSVTWKLEDPSTWPASVRAEHDLLTIMIKHGFTGDGVKSLRSGFQEQEHDRAILGWGGVVVNRGPDGKPRSMSRFEACKAKFTRPGRATTFVPVPIAMNDGRILWVDEPRHFRRIRYRLDNGHTRWYKQYGDWRTMNAMTGEYVRSTFVPAPIAFERSTTRPGKLPAKAVAAKEVQSWATSFPGAAPYGISGWHSELMSADSSAEAVRLMLSFLKSGLHSVIIAAANRPFDQTAAEAAVNKIDQLGRGRAGLGAFVTISLSPESSDTPKRPFVDESSNDRGRLILHELNTKLPTQIMDGELRAALASSFAQAERIPGLLLGKSETYNFATASAAWSTVNRLRFRPHHEDREQYLDHFLLEAGIIWWKIRIDSPEWAEKESLVSTSGVAGTYGGLSINTAVRLMGKALETVLPTRDEWWAELPFPIVAAVLRSGNMVGSLEALGYHDIAVKVAGWTPEKVADEAAKFAEELGASDRPSE
jgi:capsid portal protein